MTRWPAPRSHASRAQRSSRLTRSGPPGQRRILVFWALLFSRRDGLAMMIRFSDAYSVMLRQPRCGNYRAESRRLGRDVEAPGRAAADGRFASMPPPRLRRTINAGHGRPPRRSRHDFSFITAQARHDRATPPRVMLTLRQARSGHDVLPPKSFEARFIEAAVLDARAMSRRYF